MSGTPREPPCLRREGRSRSAAEQDGGGSDGWGESPDARWFVRGAQDHRLRCWGRNDFGQNGYGHTMPLGDDEVPSAIPDVPLLDAV